MEDLNTHLERSVLHCQNKEWQTLKESLGRILANEESLRSTLAELFLNGFSNILYSFAEQLACSPHTSISPTFSESLAVSFRCLRQVFGLNSEVQNTNQGCTQLFEHTKTILNRLNNMSSQGSEVIVVLKCCIQFLGNACASNTDRKKTIWEMFKAELRPLLTHPDPKVCEYTCMLVHTCMTHLGRADPHVLHEEVAQDVLLGAIQAAVVGDGEWGLFVLEDMLHNEMFLATLFPKMGHNERLLVVEVMIAEVSEMPEEAMGFDGGGQPTKGQGQRSLTIHPANLQHLAQDVKTKCGELLKLCHPGGEDHEESLVIVKELELLGMASCYRGAYPGLQGDTGLLECAINILRSITRLGASGTNVFTKADKASDKDTLSPHHPVYGLKKDLVRLIANMCHKHRANQDLTRTMDAIPLILDQTVMDTHNPYITQWVILAVRNLLDGNQDNRAVLSGMSLQGMAGHMGALRDMGVETELKGGKVVVRPIAKKGASPGEPSGPQLLCTKPVARSQDLLTAMSGEPATTDNQATTTHSTELSPTATGQSATSTGKSSTSTEQTSTSTGQSPTSTGQLSTSHSSASAKPQPEQSLSSTDLIDTLKAVEGMKLSDSSRSSSKGHGQSEGSRSRRGSKLVNISESGEG